MNKVRVLLSFVLIALCGLFMFGGMDCSVAFMEEEEYSILEREIAPSPIAEPEKEEAPSKEEKETAAENVPVSEEETETAPKETPAFEEEASAEDENQILDLSDVKPEDLDEKIEEIKKLENVLEIRLMDEEGKSKLSPRDVKKLMDAMPGAYVDYSFKLFGKTLSTKDTRIEYKKTSIGNNGVRQIREALDILPDCEYFLLDDCGSDNDILGKLREDYPDKKIVWRVHLSRYNCLTDTEMIHCTVGLKDSDLDGLYYCNDVMYLDLGHNMQMSDLNFIYGMPKLKVAIIVDCATTTLEPFASCPDLEWIEIVSCYNVKDLSPLAKCTKLKGLNMSCAFGVRDLSPLYGLENMERLFLGSSSITDKQYNEACKMMPNCWIRNWAKEVNGVSGNYAVGWRLEKDGTRADWYVEIRKIFKYDDLYK